MYHIFIRSSADEHLGCFHVLAIVNSGAMNIGVHMAVSVLVSSGCMPSSGIAGSYDGFIASFLRNLHNVLRTSAKCTVPDFKKMNSPFICEYNNICTEIPHKPYLAS